MKVLYQICDLFKANLKHLQRISHIDTYIYHYIHFMSPCLYTKTHFNQLNSFTVNSLASGLHYTLRLAIQN